MSHGRNNSLFIGGFLLNLVAESPKGREVPQGEAFELGNLPATKLFVWPGASLWALGKESHLVDIWELAKNSTKEGLSGKEAIRQHRKSGTLFTALYLKQCAVSLQQAYAGSESPKTLLPFPVSLTRSGYPIT